MALDKEIAFNVVDGVLLLETLQDSDDATLSTLVRLVNGFAYTIESIRLKKGYKPLLPESNNHKRSKK